VAYSIPAEVRIVFFDMDHTLIDIDSDLSWKLFLADKGLAGRRDRLIGHWHYFRYRIGRLNTESFLRFQLAQYIGKTDADMRALLDEHFRTRVLPHIYPAVFPLLDELRLRKIPCVLVTATNKEIARPLAEHLNMDALFATELERDAAGRFTGRAAGASCMGKEKLLVMEPEARRRGCTLAHAMYFGDSSLDIPILAAVGYPLAANPATKLRRKAKKRGWPIVNFTPPKKA
jgi:HAD superfamily hydrolase (TIGR01490 family)